MQSGSGNYAHYDYDTILVDFSYGYSKDQMHAAELSAETFMWNGNLKEGDSWFRYTDEATHVVAKWYVDKSLKLFPKIKVDPKRKIYTKATLKDEAGNINVCEAEIIPANFIASGYYDKSNSYNLSLFFAPDHLSGWDNLYCVYEAPDGTRNKACNLTTFTTSSVRIYKNDMKYYKNNSLVSGKDFTELDDGKYYFYVISRSGNFVTCGIKPFILYKDANGIRTSGDNTTTIPASAAPTSAQFEVTWEQGQINTGLTPIHIQLADNFTPDPRFNYRVGYRAKTTNGSGGGKNGSSTNFNFETKSFDFDVKSTYHPNGIYGYYFWIEVYNDNSYRETASQFVEINSFNISPEMKIWLIDDYAWIKPNEIAFDRNICYPLYTGGLVSANPPRYFYSDNPNLEGTINWQSDTFVKSAEYYNNTWMCPMDGGPYKYFYAYYKDVKGNSIEGRFRLYESFVGTKAKIEKTETTSTANSTTETHDTIKVSYPKPSNGYTNLCAKIERLESIRDEGDGDDEEEYEWLLYRNDNWTGDEYRDFNCINYIENENNYEFSLKYNNNYYCRKLPDYVRIYTWYGRNFGRGCETGYYDTLYVYLPGAIDPASYVCKHKDILYGVRGLQIYTDKPVMVHTIESNKDYGNNIQEWLNYGSEVKIEVDSEGFLYKEPVEKVTAGKYYTTIAHFADGDMEMTPVAQKGY